jgi:hypothetical protein
LTFSSFPKRGFVLQSSGSDLEGLRIVAANEQLWRRRPGGTMTPMSSDRGLTLAAAFCAAVILSAPAAAADAGSPSYEQGKQAIDEQVQRYHVQLDSGTDLTQYCQQVLMGDLKSCKIARVDSGPDFVAGCQDEARALLASR